MQIRQSSLKIGVSCRPGGDTPLQMEAVCCNVCGSDEAIPLAVGEDFEYRTSPDSFLAVE